MTDSKCQDKYVVHELLRPGEQPSAPCTTGEMRDNEVKGRDIVCGEDGFWRECVKAWSNRARRDIAVDAGQVVHRGKLYSEHLPIPSAQLFQVPCLGYVFRESPMQSDLQGKDEEAQAAALGRLRKLVLLGDTNDPDGIIPLVNSSPGHVALAVHEATDCYIPTHVDPQQRTGKNRTTESVHAVSLERGHSTPHMAGQFANEIGARRLVLNHIGARCGFNLARSETGLCSLAGYAGSRHMKGIKTKLASSM
jgi:ribonuclease Z